VATPSAGANEVAMKECRSAKVRKIVALKARAAKLAAEYEGAQARLAPTRHRARQLLEESRVLKGSLTVCELAELRRAWSGV
jgi:hypothetical protein